MASSVDWHPGAPMFVSSYTWLAGTTPNGATVFVTPGYGRIVAIIGRPESVESGAATVTVVRCAPGVTIANGTKVAPAMNVGVGVALDVPQTLTQAGVPEALDLAPGTLVAIQSSGSFSASAGTISIYWVAR